jgi:hypothetical protein
LPSSGSFELEYRSLQLSFSAGFFFSVLPPAATQANGAVSLIYVGAVVLAAAVISLGIGLVRAV